MNKFNFKIIELKILPSAAFLLYDMYLLKKWYAFIKKGNEAVN